MRTIEFDTFKQLKNKRVYTSNFITIKLQIDTFMASDIDSLKNAINAIQSVSSSDFELLVPLLTSATVKKHDNLLKEGEVSKSVFF